MRCLPIRVPACRLFYFLIQHTHLTQTTRRIIVQPYTHRARVTSNKYWTCIISTSSIEAITAGPGHSFIVGATLEQVWRLRQEWSKKRTGQVDLHTTCVSRWVLIFLKVPIMVTFFIMVNKTVDLQRYPKQNNNNGTVACDSDWGNWLCYWPYQE